MATDITLKYKRFESAVYDMLDNSATGPVAQLLTEYIAWQNAVNGYASNANQQLSVVKDHTSTSAPGTEIGFVLKAAGPNGDEASIWHYYSGSTTKRIAVVKTITDSGVFGDYGTPEPTQGGGYYDSSVAWRNSGYDCDFLIASCLTEGQEFFSVGFKVDPASDSYSDGWSVFKNTRGTWTLWTNDGSTHAIMSYYDDEIGTGFYTPSRNTTVATSASQAGYVSTGIYRLAFSPSTPPSTIQSFDADVYSVSCAHPMVYSWGSGLSGQYYYYDGIGDGTEAYGLVVHSYGMLLLIDNRV